MIQGTLVSVRTGVARTHARPSWDHGRTPTWRSAFVKEEVAGPVHVGPLGLEGDVQVDRRGHGGPEMAVLMYGAEHYEMWRTLPGLAAMGPGGFAENLTVSGADEHTVCVGDVLEVGGALLQVASPRGPCANISRRWDAEWLLERVREERRTGWYMRVRREGPVAKGDAVRLIERLHPEWSVDRLLRMRFVTPRDPAELHAAAALESLSEEWRERYRRLAGESHGSSRPVE